MESCHIRLMWSNNILLYPLSSFMLQAICLGSNIVCNDQLNRARVGVFSPSMQAISFPSNMDNVLGSLAV